MSEIVGSISYTVTLDTEELIRSQKDVDRATQQASNSLSSVGKAAQNCAISTGLAEAANRRAAKSFDEVGISSKQMSAAMRAVPAQFTDIVTSLQGGQAPLTVFLQQGGQLRDMFGGAGPAARALAGYIAGLVNPFTVAAAAAGVLAYGYYKGSQEAQEFAATIELTGNRSGTTADQLMDLAKGMDSVAGVTRGQAAAALNAFVALGIKASAGIDQLATAAIRLEREGGRSVQQIAKDFKDLQNDPLKAALKLDEAVGFLTESLYKQIKALEDQGDKAGAAKLAQDAYAQAIEKSSSAIEENLGYIERAWRGIVNAAREAADAVLSFGRAQTGTERIQTLEKQIQANKQLLAEMDDAQRGAGFFKTDDSRGRAIAEARIKAAQAEIEAIKAKTKGENESAAAAAQTRAQVSARAEADRDGLRYLADEVRMRRQIARETATLRAAGADEAEIQQRIKDIEKSYEKKERKAPKSPSERFDSEAYLSDLRKAASSEIAVINETETEKLRINDKRLRAKEIDEREHAAAILEITAAAEKARAELLAKTQADIDRGREAADRKAEQQRQERDRARMSALEAATGGNPIEKVRLEEEAKLAEQEAAYQKGLISLQLYEDAKVGIKKAAADRIQEIEDDLRAKESRALSVMLQNYGGLFGNIADLTKAFAGEQSGVYKAMFAVSKAFAIADSIVKIQNAMASASMSAPFPANLAAMATVAASTAGIISTISSTNFGGGRQYGGPVSAGTLYRVNETGRPEMFTAANGNQYMLPTAGGQVTAANEVSGGKSVVINQTVNVAAGASYAEVMTACNAAKEQAKAEILRSISVGGVFSR